MRLYDLDRRDLLGADQLGELGGVGIDDVEVHFLSYLTFGRHGICLSIFAVKPYLTLGRLHECVRGCSLSANSREAILAAATQIAQAHGYQGLNFRDLAADVGIKAPSIYHHFASKADLGAAVAKRYWEDTAAALDGISAEFADDPARALHEYPTRVFQKTHKNNNRLCLC